MLEYHEAIHGNTKNPASDNRCTEERTAEDPNCSDGHFLLPDTLSVGALIFTGDCWPDSRAVPLVLPLELSYFQERFETIYEERKERRKLTWISSLATGTLETTFFVDGDSAGALEMDVTLHQMCVLMLFNDSEVLTYEQLFHALIQTWANTEEKREAQIWIRAAVNSLAGQRYPLLRKEIVGQGTLKDHRILLNHRFRARAAHLSIPVPTKNDFEGMDFGDNECEVEDREALIDTFLIRFMKQRRTLNCQALVNEAIKSISLPINVEKEFILTRIESLVDREYLEREKDRQDWLVYVP